LLRGGRRSPGFGSAGRDHAGLNVFNDGFFRRRAQRRWAEERLITVSHGEPIHVRSDGELLVVV